MRAKRPQAVRAPLSRQAGLTFKQGSREPDAGVRFSPNSSWRLVACPDCQQPVGTRCVSANGRIIPRQHASRQRLGRRAAGA